MATRSNIGILNENGSVDYIYCHWDGYISNNGVILYEDYNSEEQVRELIALGDISSLGGMLSECVIKNPYPAQTTSYEEYTSGDHESYTYLFKPGKGWYVRTYGADFWASLEDAVSEINT